VQKGIQHVKTGIPITYK